MQLDTRPRVKICCISSITEATQAIESGASALGLVGEMPSGPGVITDALIREIASEVPPPISTFLLTSETLAPRIIAHHEKVKTDTIQLVDSVDEGTYRSLRLVLPGIKLVQVIHVIDEKSVDQAIMASSFVDAILLDSGNPNQSVKVLGGTGKTHNWNLSRKIRDQIDKPLFLAGGLNAGNVRQAFEQVKPFGIDLCSGVRTNGSLDPVKLAQFFDEINKL